MSETISVLYLNSAQANTKDLTKAKASFVMDPPLVMPGNCKLKVTCTQFSFTNWFLNVSAALANNHFVISDNIGGGHTFTLVIPDGSYNVTDLSNAINVAGINAGLVDGLVQLVPDFSTNKVLFKISVANYQISFPAGTMYALLGTNLAQLIPAGGFTAAAYNELAPLVANFNSVLNVYLHTSLSNNAVFSGKQSNVIASIIPVASVGSIQIYEPPNLIMVDAHELVSASISTINIYLTDQNNNSLYLTDDFSSTILIQRVADPISYDTAKRPQPF